MTNVTIENDNIYPSGCNIHLGMQQQVYILVIIYKCCNRIYQEYIGQFLIKLLLDSLHW